MVFFSNFRNSYFLFIYYLLTGGGSEEGIILRAKPRPRRTAVVAGGAAPQATEWLCAHPQHRQRGPDGVQQGASGLWAPVPPWVVLSGCCSGALGCEGRGIWMCLERSPGSHSGPGRRISPVHPWCLWVEPGSQASRLALGNSAQAGPVRWRSEERCSSRASPAQALERLPAIWLSQRPPLSPASSTRRIAGTTGCP